MINRTMPADPIESGGSEGSNCTSMHKFFDLRRIPFSRFGSYLIVVEHTADSPRKPAGLPPGVWLSGVHGFHAARETFRLALFHDGQEVPFVVEAQPSHLILRAKAGHAELCIAEPDLVRLRCQGVELRLLLREGKYNYVVPQSSSRWLVNASDAFVLFTASGDCQVESRWEDSHATRVALVVWPGGELALHQHVGFTEPRCITGTFDEARQRVATQFQAFAEPYGRVEGMEAAAFVNWSSVVEASGQLRRPSMLMSKNWMSNVWAWDHAINALALAEHHPALAWDQMLTIFDQQLPTGQIPDLINDAVRFYNYVKPPIHGWVWGQMLDRNPWFNDPGRLAEFYGPLERWTEWWLRFRLHESLGLPEYYHGNDSGWDNGTVFDAGLPAVSGDVAAFLVLQLETLARVARRLGNVAAAESWTQRSQLLLQNLLRHLWNGRRFVVLNAAGKIAEKSDSIFGSLPIILGQRLPVEIRQALAVEIRRHLTEWGLATENPASALYTPEGYWRGPIWAPPTLFIIAGLRAAGETELARDIALRFCRLCQMSGFPENFEALTGAPQCDPAYTWTSSVFLVLAGEVLGERDRSLAAA